MSKSFSESYKAAGVDITAGYKAVELMKSHIARTMTKNVVSVIVPLLSLLLQCQRLVDTAHTPERGGSIATRQFEYHAKVELHGRCPVVGVCRHFNNSIRSV